VLRTEKNTIFEIHVWFNPKLYSTIEAINDISNPADRFTAQLNEINDRLTTLVNKKGLEAGH
jgi:hypothetical protein